MRRPSCRSLLLSVTALATSAGAGINQWTPTGPEGGRASIVRFDPSSPSTVYAVVSGTLFRSTDSGATWVRRDSGMQVPPQGYGIPQLEVDPGSSANLVVISVDRLFASHDAGATWQASDIASAGLDSLLATQSALGGTFFMAQQGSGRIYRSTDAGDSWTQLGVTANAGPAPIVCGFVVDQGGW